MHEDDSKSLYLGIVEGKSTVTTFESRLTFTSFDKLADNDFQSFKHQLAKKLSQTNFQKTWDDLSFIASLSPDLSLDASNVCRHLNPELFSSLHSALSPPRRMPPRAWEQRDALRTAVQIFGLDPNNDLSGRRTLFEDQVVFSDATEIPGFSLIEQNVTGRRVFQKNNESLHVYLANKGPLEEALGVDLIYVNQTLGNTVMVQYKMLEPANEDWIFRADAQFTKERARMVLPLMSNQPDYRLNASPFFFKFVKRTQASDTVTGFVVANDHLTAILDSPASIGPKGGVRISYEALDGVYLRPSDFVPLVRSGYIGCYQSQTEHLTKILEAVAEGDRALVLAWQQKFHLASDGESADCLERCRTHERCQE